MIKHLKNILINEDEIEFTLKDRIILFLFTVKDTETGTRRVRHSEFAQNIVLNHFNKISAKQKKKMIKFSLENLIEYPKRFAEENRTQNRPFAINVSTGQLIDIQIIHPSMIIDQKRTHTDQFGFTIHLPFDTTDPNAMDELLQFKQKEYFPSFQHIAGDGIEDYLLDCGENYDY